MFKISNMPFISMIEEGGDNGGGGTTDPAATDADKVTEPQSTEPKFPANTPLKDMTVDQQAAYWQDKARKHEDRVKAFGDLTPEAIKELQTKSTEHETALTELNSQHEAALTAAIEKAKADGRAEALQESAPSLVIAEFKAAAAGRASAEQLLPLLEDINHSKFLTADGKVDSALIQSRIDTLFPAGNGNTAPPAANHNGYRQTKGASSVAAGRELYYSTRKSTKNS